MTIYLIGMCYSGKTTIGRLLGERLGVKWLDSRDIFKSVYKVTENEYLLQFPDDFQEAERNLLLNDFGDTVVSLSGSSVYYEKEMEQLKTNHEILWIDMALPIIKQRKEAENWIRPIVYPEGFSC